MHLNTSLHYILNRNQHYLVTITFTIVFKLELGYTSINKGSPKMFVAHTQSSFNGPTASASNMVTIQC